MGIPLVVCIHCKAKNRVPEHKRNVPAKCGRCGKSLDTSVLTGVVQDLDEAGLKNLVAKSGLPVLVDYYSPTCGPCRMVAPLIVNVAQSYSGQVVVAKINTSTHPGAGANMGVKGVPTLVFFHNGREVDRIVGACPQAEIERRLQAILR